MALFSRIYFNAVFGALGGLFGWMLFGVFSDPNVHYDPQTEAFLGSALFWQLLMGGAMIGGCIGYFVVSVESIRDRSLLRFARLSAYGVVLGAVGGTLGILIGEGVNFQLIRWMGAAREHPLLHMLGAMMARGLGWLFLGVAVGFSEGIAARSLGKFSYGTLGGAIGGFIGGMLFDLAYEKAIAAGGHAAAWEAIGFIILGACIGSLSALVQSVFVPASVKVLRGWQEGREYPLDKIDNLLGRDEHADIALFRDMKVEKKHAVIQREGQRYLLLNHDAPSEWTRVNDRPVLQCCDLHDGDRIQLGNVILRFQSRAAAQRKRRGRL
ncbi:MAG: FHA domain-containing protein [Gemmataceae bacterium]